MSTPSPSRIPNTDVGMTRPRAAARITKRDETFWAEISLDGQRRALKSMNLPIPSREEEIFSAVVELPVRERTDVLEKACRGDAALRQAVAELLWSHDRAEGFLEPLVAEMAQVAALARALAESRRR